MSLVTKFGTDTKRMRLTATVEDDATGEVFLIATAEKDDKIKVERPDGTAFPANDEGVYTITKDGKVIGELLHTYLYYLVQYGKSLYKRKG